jgi:hypothetical protein
MAQSSQSESSSTLTIRGAVPKLKAEDAVRIAAYLVRGDEVLVKAPLDEKGHFRVEAERALLAGRTGAQFQVVIGPAAMGRFLDPSRNLPRVPLDPAEIERAKREFVVPTDKFQITEATLKLWWVWCRNYCVSGVVVGPDGCPVPGAQVTVSSVLHASGGGFSVTPQKTVSADSTGHFTACFDWCTTCLGWPCWPIWWFCWPWWWEWDILRIIEEIEGRLAVVPHVGPVPPGPLAVQRIALPLKQPSSADLMIGQGFAATRASDLRLVPDQARTELIRRKLADPRIRAVFPWWWWCCENPNIIFTVQQGANIIVNENPATDTRWCFPDGSTVTLVGNQSTISACGGDPCPAHGFVWTRVGNTLVNTILQGYAQGSVFGHDSDLAFTGTLDIFGQFACGSNLAYYQVFAGQWTGDPARGGTPPAGAGAPLGADLYNYAFMLHPGPVVTVEAVKMGPFNNGALTNLYATEEHRHLVPAAFLPPFPAGTFMAWAYSGRKLNAAASQLVGGSLGSVTLSVAAFDASFAPVAQPANPDDKLTLTIDTTGLSMAHINTFKAYDSSNAAVTSTGGSVDCPAYNLGAGGYVVLNVSVTDNNGHLCEYELVPNFGHGSTGTTVPDVRGYRTPTPFVPAPAPGPYTEPDLVHKSFIGGTEDIKFSPMVDCCYDFRLDVRKRVTDGFGVQSMYTADFWTATLKVS